MKAGLLPKIFLGSGVYVGGMYAAYQFAQIAGANKKAVIATTSPSTSPGTGTSTSTSTSTNICARRRTRVTEEERRDAYDKGAATYDGSIGMDEFFMGMPLLRRYLLSGVRGKVVEVAAGTGTERT